MCKWFMTPWLLAPMAQTAVPTTWYLWQSLQLHQILRLPGKVTLQDMTTKRMKPEHSCAADLTMIQAWTEPVSPPTKLSFRALETHFVRKNPTFRAPAIPNFHQILRPRKVAASHGLFLTFLNYYCLLGFLEAELWATHGSWTLQELDSLNARAGEDGCFEALMRIFRSKTVQGRTAPKIPHEIPWISRGYRDFEKNQGGL